MKVYRGNHKIEKKSGSNQCKKCADLRKQIRLREKKIWQTTWLSPISYETNLRKRDQLQEQLMRHIGLEHNIK